MTIKEKLQSLGIDTTKEKAKVEEAKAALLEANESFTKITSKITSSGEKILDNLFGSLSKTEVKKSVKRPNTIRATSNTSDGSASSNADTKPKAASSGEEANASDEKKQSNKASTTKIIINIGGDREVRDKNSSPNGRPLPQATIDALKRQKEKELERKEAAKNEAVQKDNEGKPNVQVKVNKGPQGFNRGNADRPFKPNGRNANDNRDKQHGFQNKPQSQGGKPDNRQGFSQTRKPSQGSVKTIFNPNTATIATGTNKSYSGKKQSKSKNDKDREKKQSQKAQIKDKSRKYSSNLVNSDYENDNVRTTVRKAGAFIKPEVKQEKPIDDIKSITIPDVISIKDLSSKLHLQPSIIVKKLFLTGKIVNVNTELTYEEAENIALEYDILCEKEVKVDVIAELLKETEEDPATLVPRPPVVCVMGHVDHGKTSILDTIRNTNVIAKEAGGITQHIGAYQVKVKDRLITFLDTPGHEAFTAMRLRGAKSTDIAILVVAADDGVKPQTIEAINHAKAANVEIIVAINKIDKPEANVERVKQQLSEYELVPADWGGQTTYCEVSAKKNIGIDNLLDMVLLTADVMDLKANPNRRARGIVIESLLDKGKGPVARILVQKGTLHVGDYVAMGKSFGKVRAMSDASGMRVTEATPSMPVEVLGLNDVPQAGDTFLCFDEEKEAREFAETFVAENKIKLVEESKHKVTLDALFDQIKAGELKELNIVLKADVAGSSEAIKNSLEKLSNDEVVVKVIHEGVGNINESDVTLASASNAIIIGFNVKPEANTRAIIEREKVDLRLYNIIYNAIDDVEKAMKGMLAPVFEEKVIGSVVIRQIFKASSVGNIAGSYVTDGEARRNAKVRLKRGDKVVFDGGIASLKRFKDEVKEVKAGFECGIVLEGFNDYQVDDVMEVYVIEEKKVNYENE